MKRGALEPIAALNRVKIVETGEPLVDIRDGCPAVQVVEQACPYLRAAVAGMLNRAAASLPTGHRFRVGTALRTLAMQKGGWDGYYRRMQEEHPNWPLSALRRATNRYFAPYDQPAPPGHCTGGAVDVQLLGLDGEPLDVTSPSQGWEAAYTWSDRLSPEAKRNRMILVEAMLTAGFSNCREEFWHYSWGDSAWAVRVGERTCPYGLIEPPPVVEARYVGACADDLMQIGERAWNCRPIEGHLDVGLFWAQDREMLLYIAWPGDAPAELYQSADRKTWEPQEISKAEGGLRLVVTPVSDRLYIASEIPALPPQQP